MTVRVLHISDNHGVLYPLRTSRVDAIVHSGDLFPTLSDWHKRSSQEAALQEAWIVNNAERLCRWTQGRPFLYCTGNHDYTSGEEILRSVGVDAICLNDRIVTFADHTFYGFPWTKFFTGTWNMELRVPEMGMRLAAVPDVDILVSHGPIEGVLDVNSYGEQCGCPQLRNSFLYDDCFMKGAQALLHGHIHESHGVCTWQGMTVSNAATTQHILEL